MFKIEKVALYNLTNIRIHLCRKKDDRNHVHQEIHAPRDTRSFDLLFSPNFEQVMSLN